MTLSDQPSRVPWCVAGEAMSPFTLLLLPLLVTGSDGARLFDDDLVGSATSPLCNVVEQAQHCGACDVSTRGHLYAQSHTANL